MVILVLKNLLLLIRPSDSLQKGLQSHKKQNPELLNFKCEANAQPILLILKM